MEKKKYQIFISSTYDDLRIERDKVRDAILSMFHFPVGMELFGAADEEQWEIIKETIDTSDYYVLLVGQRYGTVITEGPDAGISYTEKEFRYAKEQKIPILAFIIDDNVQVKAKDVEREHISEFEAFKDSVKSGRTVDWWKNPDELAQKVTAALYKQINRGSRPGWIRGDSIDVVHELVELSNAKRELEEKVKKLTNTRQPQLVFDIKQYGTRQEPYKEGKELKTIKLHDIEKNGYLTRPRELNWDDAIGVPNTNTNMISEYNRQLPTEEEVKKYNESVYNFRMKVENGYYIRFELRNDGDLKANNVILQAEFSDDCIVTTWRTVYLLNPPRKLDIPSNPIELQKMKNKLGPFEGIAEFADAINARKNEYYGDGEYKIHSIMEATPEYAGRIVNKKAIVNQSSLLHKSEVAYGDFCIIPKSKGTFSIKITLMCEEYTEPVTQCVEFSVD